MTTCGIYKIENNINHKVYIGQSVRCETRYREHKHAARNKNSPDHKLAIHQAMSKYGMESFTFTIVEKCTKEELNEREVYWISFFNSYKKGYNETEGGNESHIHIGRRIEVYDLDGKYIRTYANMTEAAKEIGISRNTIYGVVYGRRLSGGGFQFKRVGDDKKISRYNNRQGGKIKIKQIDIKSGKCIKVWDSSYEVARELGFDSSAISKCVRGKFKSVGGFNWVKF